MKSIKVLRTVKYAGNALVLLTLAFSLSGCVTVFDLFKTDPPTPTPAPANDTQFRLGYPSYDDSAWDEPMFAPMDDNADSTDTADAAADYPELRGDEPGYAKMPESGSQANDTKGYTAADAKDINHDNFLKLKIGMSEAEVKEILKTDKVDTYDHDDGKSLTFYNDSRMLTSVRVTIRGKEVTDISYDDEYRLCVEATDINMEKFKTLKAGLSLKEIEELLGGSGFMSDSYADYSGKGTDDTYAWFNDRGEIRVVFEPSGKAALIIQKGFQYVPDRRSKYAVLTDQELMDNFAKVELGGDYEALEKQMNNYIPLYETQIAGDEYTSDSYEFKRSDKSFISIYFTFRDGRLVDKKFSSYPLELMPRADFKDAKQVKVGMTYEQVKDVMGIDGYIVSETVGWDEKVERQYYWGLSEDKNDCIQITFVDGKIESEYGIFLYEATF